MDINEVKVCPFDSSGLVFAYEGREKNQSELCFLALASDSSHSNAK